MVNIINKSSDNDDGDLDKNDKMYYNYSERGEIAIVLLLICVV